MKKKQCKVGISCGKSCIAKTKACKVELAPEVSSTLDKKTGSGASLDSYMETAKTFLSSIPTDDVLEEKILKAEKNLKKKYTDKKYWELRDLQAQKQERVLEAIRGLSTPDTVTMEWNDVYPFEPLSGEDRAKAEGNIKLLMDVVGKNPFGDTPIAIFKDRKRAWAKRMPPMVDIGDGKTTTVFHELGHHIEFNNPELAQAAVEFRSRRATSQDTKSMPGYESNEQFLPGKFISPYMGKVYTSGDTEVISMGLEWFSSTHRMHSLQEKDPELYNFMIGYIVKNRTS